MYGSKFALLLAPLVSAIYVDMDTDRHRPRHLAVRQEAAPAAAPPPGMGGLGLPPISGPAGLPFELSFIGRRSHGSEDSEDESGDNSEDDSEEKPKKGSKKEKEVSEKGSKQGSEKDSSSRKGSDEDSEREDESEEEEKPKKKKWWEIRPEKKPAPATAQYPAAQPLAVPAQLRVGGSAGSAKKPKQGGGDESDNQDTSPHNYGPPASPGFPQGYPIRPALPALYPGAPATDPSSYSSSYKFEEGNYHQSRELHSRKRQLPSKTPLGGVPKPDGVAQRLPAQDAAQAAQPATDNAQGIDAKSAPHTAASIPLPLISKRQINANHRRRMIRNADYQQREYARRGSGVRSRQLGRT